MAKITIIVPVYNVEQYIEICLDSILAQTFDDYVAFVVNDGSPANEQVIIDRYAKKDKRIKAIQKENGGYGSVLQWAIANCETEYFIICDPDDYFAPDALEALMAEAKRSNADLVIGAKNFLYMDGEQEYDAAYNKDYVVLEDRKIYQKGTKAFDNLYFVDPSPHSKLYKKTLAENIVFPNKISYTDNLLFYISLLNANTVSYIDKVCAYYLIDRAGNTSTDLRPTVMQQLTQVFTTILKQSESIANKPSIYYWRLFEAFKYIMHTAKRVQATREQMIEQLDILYPLVELLLPYRKEILNEYKEYSKAGKKDELKNYLFLSPLTSKMVYNYRVKRILNEKGL
jgi:Glycosyltransferases involved in cell wall biogenesis